MGLARIPIVKRFCEVIHIYLYDIRIQAIGSDGKFNKG